MKKESTRAGSLKGFHRVRCNERSLWFPLKNGKRKVECEVLWGRLPKCSHTFSDFTNCPHFLTTSWRYCQSSPLFCPTALSYYIEWSPKLLYNNYSVHLQRAVNWVGPSHCKAVTHSCRIVYGTLWEVAIDSSLKIPIEQKNTREENENHGRYFVGPQISLCTVPSSNMQLVGPEVFVRYHLRMSYLWRSGKMFFSLPCWSWLSLMAVVM